MNNLNLIDDIKLSSSGVKRYDIETQPLTSFNNLDKNLIKKIFKSLGIKDEDIVLDDPFNVDLEALRINQDDCNCDDQDTGKQTIIQKINDFLKKELQKILDAIPPLDEITEEDIQRLLDEAIKFLDTVLKTDLHLKNEEQLKEGIYQAIQFLVKVRDTVDATALVKIIKLLQYLNTGVFQGRIGIIFSNVITLISIDVRLLLLVINALTKGISLISDVASVVLGLLPPNLAVVLSIIGLIVNVIFFGIGLVQNIGTAISYSTQIWRASLEIIVALLWMARNVSVVEIENILKQMVDAVRTDPFVKEFVEWLKNAIKTLQDKLPQEKLVLK